MFAFNLSFYLLFKAVNMASEKEKRDLRLLPEATDNDLETFFRILQDINNSEKSRVTAAAAVSLDLDLPEKKKKNLFLSFGQE